MIQLKLKDLMDDSDFLIDFLEVSRIKFKSDKLNYDVCKILQKVQSLGKAEIPTYEKKRKELLTEFADKDEQGKPILKDGRITQMTDDNKEAFRARLEELLERDLSIEFHQIDVNKLLAEKDTKGEAILSGASMNNLTPILFGFENLK